jgi:DNA gyrase subunit A
VDWEPNYDQRLKEPKVLPTKIPQLLLNGSTGIAVGMATSIPPHNLGEVVDALIHLIDNPEASIDDLMQFIKGPDFPTGGIIYDTGAIKTAYSTGRGGIVMRAVAEIEEKKGGRFAIVITEIPYQINKKTLVEKIADLVRDKKIIGISDLRDESNRLGIRVVIELKKDSYPKKILNQLFKYTAMQSSFNMNMIALVDSVQPRLLELKQVLEEFVKHRKEVIMRRTQFDLKVAQERVHILEGLKIALDHIDEVIATIRKSDTKEAAHEALMKKFKLSDRQAKAILEMRLQTLAGLERKKIDDEYKELLGLIEELESILKDEKKVMKIIKKELATVKEKYAEPRKTKIVTEAVGEISQKDTIPNEAMIVVLTQENYIKRMPPNTFRAQNRGGKGIIGATTKEEDEIKVVRSAMTHDEMMFFTNTGRVFQIPVYDIPVASRTARGQAIVNLLQLKNDEFVTAVFPAGKQLKGEHLLMATKKGNVKKTSTKDFMNVRKTGLIAIKLRDGDSLEWVREVNKDQEAVIITRNGKSIRFKESDVRAMGRASMGVRGILLKDQDRVVEMDIIQNSKTSELLVVMENGLGKSTNMEEYRLQNRGGSGVKTANITERTGHIVGARVVNDDTNEDLLLISKSGQVIRLNIRQIPSKGRATQGVYLMRLDENDKVASMSTLYAETPEEAGETEKKEESQTEMV